MPCLRWSHISTIYPRSKQRNYNATFVTAPAISMTDGHGIEVESKRLRVGVISAHGGNCESCREAAHRCSNYRWILAGVEASFSRRRGWASSHSSRATETRKLATARCTMAINHSDPANGDGSSRVMLKTRSWGSTMDATAPTRATSTNPLAHQNNGEAFWAACLSMSLLLCCAISQPSQRRQDAPNVSRFGKLSGFLRLGKQAIVA